MTQATFRRIHASRLVATIVALAATLTVAAVARADDVLGLYLGGSVGQSQVNANGGSYNAASFKENHSGWKAIVGLKPIPLIGAEAEYIDFGHPSGSLGTAPADVTMKGAAAFGVLTLPVPVIDIFAKAGLARLQSTVNGTTGPVCPGGGIPGCSLFSLSRHNTSGAAGAGVGLKLGAMRIRAEYERFNAAGGNPSMASLGATWTFL